MFRLVIGLILVTLPLLELAVLIKVGQAVGFWPTFGMVVGAGLLGAFIMSRGSLGVLRRTTQALEQGRPPVADALDGAFLLMAGMLLITPGFVTDFMALLLLVPPLRHALARWTVVRAIERGGLAGSSPGADGTTPGEDVGRSSAGQGNGPVIEGEFERLGEKPADPQATKR
jgi:UPF0716 protein FxsA